MKSFIQRDLTARRLLPNFESNHIDSRASGRFPHSLSPSAASSPKRTKKQAGARTPAPHCAGRRSYRRLSRLGEFQSSCRSNWSSCHGWTENYYQEGPHAKLCQHFTRRWHDQDIRPLIIVFFAESDKAEWGSSVDHEGGSKEEVR